MICYVMNEIVVKYEIVVRNGSKIEVDYFKYY